MNHLAYPLLFVLLVHQQKAYPPDPPSIAIAKQQERDKIFMLAVYVHVLQDWQSPGNKHGRGHNIGSILVDPDGHPVFAARNENAKHRNTTQHGEVRLMSIYLEETQKNTLRGYTVYTSLEPCAMCGGMMTLAEVQRCVYGQTDPDYGMALERLQLDSTKNAGYKPYPRPVKSESSTGDIRQRLDDAYSKNRGKMSLTEWLRTSEAKEIYQMADGMLKNFSPHFDTNRLALSEARALVCPRILDATPQNHIPCKWIRPLRVRLARPGPLHRGRRASGDYLHQIDCGDVVMKKRKLVPIKERQRRISEGLKTYWRAREKKK